MPSPVRRTASIVSSTAAVAAVAAVAVVVALVASSAPAARPGGAPTKSPKPKGKPSQSPSASPSASPTPTSSPGDAPVIRVAGDIACDPADGNYNGGAGTATACRMRATSDLLAGASAVLTLGDNQYENGTLSTYDASYDPTWGRFKAMTFPVPGNHEYHTSGAAGYYAYFGSVAGDPAKGYYSYDIGDWHLIALNSNCSAVGGCGAGSAQEQWLRADLAAHSNACTLAYWHHPRFSSGPHGNNAAYDAFWKALYDFDADLILNGHDHDYERFAPQTPAGVADASRGIREFVVGTGGKTSYSFSTIRANSEVRHTGTYGVLELTLYANAYDWRFLAEAGKTFSDSGSTACH